jgi:hypothetical protein
MNDTDSALRALEKHWQLALPPAFERLYHAFEYPFLNPCEFLSLGELLEDAERWRGMLPQFLPFGHDGEENFFGFYIPPITAGSDYPVLFWEHEYDHYAPVASGFEAFLRWCVIFGRYEAQDEFDQDDPERAEEEQQRREFARVVGLPPELTTDALPRNERELYGRLLASDSQNASALAQKGTHYLAHEDLERARDFFTRSSEATPWFADPYYLLAQTYLLEQKPEQAVRRLWQVFQCPIALSTRTGNYDLGTRHEDAEIYEASADQFARHSGEAGGERQQNALGCLLLSGELFDPQSRLALANELAASGDSWGEEREMLNALTLATEGRDIAAAYDRLIAFYMRAKRPRDAVLCHRDRDRL